MINDIFFEIEVQGHAITILSTYRVYNFGKEFNLDSSIQEFYFSYFLSWIFSRIKSIIKDGRSNCVNITKVNYTSDFILIQMTRNTIMFPVLMIV